MTVRHKPLKGQHVLITRGGEQGEKFCMDVANAGGIPHMVPLIDFRPYKDVNESYYKSNISQYDWIIFTSKNGVHHFFQHFKENPNEQLFNEGKIKFAVVGEKTKEALERYHIASHFMPNVYTAEAFANEFDPLDEQPKKVLIAKGNLASTVIAERFRTQGIRADEWIIYETFYPTANVGKLTQLLKNELINVAAFTSPSTFNHFLKIVQQHHLSYALETLIVAAIGTVTKQRIEQAGIKVHICPDTFTIDEMFAAICSYFERKEDTF